MARSLSTFLRLLQAYLLTSHTEGLGSCLWHTLDLDLFQAYIMLFEAPTVVKRIWTSYIDLVPPSNDSVYGIRDSYYLRTSGGILYLLYMRDGYYL